jgi:hypothetical protein
MDWEMPRDGVEPVGESAMSPQIQPPEGSGGAHAVTAVRRSARTARAGSAVPVAVPTPVSLDTTPSAPPPEVLEQMRAAAANLDRLHSSGLEVRFAGDAGAHRASAGLYDRSGTLVRELTAAQALDLAAGGAQLEEVLR